MASPPKKLLAGRHTCKPRKYAHRDVLPSTKEAQALVVGVEDCLRVPPIPQSQEPALTGVYEDTTHAKTSVAINHAGTYVALWISGLEGSTVEHYVGVGTSPLFSLSRADAPGRTVGSLGPSSDHPEALEIDLEADGWSKVTLVRVNRKVTLSDRALSYLGGGADADLVRFVEHSPVSTLLLQEIEEILTGPKMHRLLDAFFGAELSWRDRAEIAAAGTAIESHVQSLGHVFAEHPAALLTVGKRGPFRRAPRRAAPLLFRHALGAMHAEASVITIQATMFRDIIGASGLETVKSVFERLTDVLATLRSELLTGEHVRTPGIQAIGIPTPEDEPLFAYECKVDATGIAGDAGIGVSAFKGTLLVRQIKPTEHPEPIKLAVFLLGSSGGLSVGIRSHFKATGVGTSTVSWTREDLLGRVSIYESVSNVPLKSAGFTEWLIRGTGGKAPLSVKFGTADTVSIEFGREASASVGYIREHDDAAGGASEFFKPPPEFDEDYVTAYTAGAETHFELGSATLSSEGRNILGWLAAAELAALRSPLTRVHFLGSADRVDTIWYNQTLSKMRADNALQTLRDVAGAQLRARMGAVGLGEMLPIAAGDVDGKENPEFRRVWVQMDGHTVASLRGSNGS